MADHRIIITFDGTQFKYTDENGADAHDKHVYTHDTIEWELVATGAAAKKVASLRIVFNKHGDPCHNSEFDAPVGAFTNPAKLDFPNAQKTYPYTAIAVYKDGAQVPNDPTIIFDDVVLDPHLQLADHALSVLGPGVQAAFQGVLADLKTTTGLKRDPDGEFFPGGINSIQVQVTVPLGTLSVVISVAVSGPGATVLGPGPARRK
jgi:hypothetical protein